MEKDQLEFIHPDGGYGWVIVAAIILINSTLLTLVQCFGIIFGREFTHLGITSAEKSFLLHLHSSMYCSIGFFCSPLLKKYSFRLVAFFGASLMCMGIFMTSFATSYNFLIFTVSFIIGTGQGVLMPATYLATYSYFKKRLTLAVSLSVTGAGLSAVAMPKICDILLSYTNRTNTVLILFVVSLLSLVGCFLLKPITKQAKEVETSSEMVKNESNIENKEEVSDTLLENSKVYKDTTVPMKKDTVWIKIQEMFDLQLLTYLPYVLTIIGMGVSFASELNIVLMIQFILPELSHFSRTDVANAVIVQAIADIIGRLAIPILSHICNIHPKVMYSGALILATFGRTVLTVWYQSRLTVYFACGIIGLTKGARAVFQSVIIPKIVPLEKIPAANGINMLFTGAVSLILGPLIGLVRDYNHSYVYALHTCSVLSMSCVVLWVLQALFLKKSKPVQ